MKYSTLNQEQRDNLAQEKPLGGLPAGQNPQSNPAKVFNFINSFSQHPKTVTSTQASRPFFSYR